MPEIRSSKETSDGWIVRRMSEIKSESKEWPQWVHAVRVSPQPLESTLDESLQSESALPASADAKRMKGEG